MPKNTNDKNELKDKLEEVVNTIKSRVVKKDNTTSVKKDSNKKTTTAKKASGKSSTSTSKKTSTTKTSNSSASKTGTKKTTRAKVVNLEEDSTADVATTSAKKSTTSRKRATSSSTKKASTKKTSTRTKKATTSKEPPVSIIEYYDLPYRYNQTVVKILAQTPKMLFVYWDIADRDREQYKEYYGEDFFENSRPVLIIHNETMNYSFELEINDFANSWYIHVNDANCKYNVELGRRPNTSITNTVTNVQEHYIYISSSNHLDAPNDHILFEKALPKIKYRNVKNNHINMKDFSNSIFVKQIMHFYSVQTIEQLYEKLYSEELLEDFKNGYYKNPTSNPSSNFR